MNLAHGFATYALILLGIVHIGMAPVFFEQFTMRTMWYVAQGLMGVYVAFLNIACRRLEWGEPVIVTLTHLTNAFGLVFGVLYATVDPSPPSYVAIGLFVLLIGTGLGLWRGRNRAGA